MNAPPSPGPNTEPAGHPAPARLPLVGEATRPPERPSVASRTPPPDAALPGRAAPIIALHGVGDFEPGDVIGEMARHSAFSRHDTFSRETLFARNYRYSVLLEREAHDAHAAADDRDRSHRETPRLLEVNWSEVRRATPNVLGILRNFVLVLFALNRIAVFGAARSTTLSGRLATGGVALWIVEGLAVWAALVPCLSTLLWQLERNQRLAAACIVAAAAFYAAIALRHASRPMAAGGVLFAAYCLGAGWWTCCEYYGDQEFAAVAALTHVLCTLLAVFAVLVTALEIAVRRGPDGQSMPFVHRLSRMACLWLPMVMLMLLQPLTVSALLVPMDADARSNWGYAFSRLLPFQPEEVQRAVGWIALLLAGGLGVGALLYKLIQGFGRNATLAIGWLAGIGLLLFALAVDTMDAADAAICRECLYADWMGGVGLLLSGGASVTWALFARSDVARDAAGRPWYPAGAFARFWASVVLAAMPLVLIGAVSWLVLRIPPRGGELVVADASAVFIQSTKYALLLAPLATKPFAAFLDALGDVFFFVVRNRSLSTRLETMPRLWKALQLLVSSTSEPGHVIVLAHSQGTAIAAAMFSRMVGVLSRSHLRLTLVTVGSPVTTLYRNFLGVQVGAAFAALCRDRPAQFRWYNLCRPADYIGGAVELPGVVNRDLLTEGDHIGYWSDAELMTWLAGLSRGKPG